MPASISQAETASAHQGPGRWVNLGDPSHL